MPTAYSYSRVSTPRQVAGFGLERQAIDGTRKWCEENGLTLDESNILQDVGSGFHGDNLSPTAALGGFLEAVQKGKIERGSYLVIEHLNRLTRERILQALALLLMLLSHGINLVTSHDKRIYSAESKVLDIDLILAIVFLMDAHRSSMDKQRVALNNWSKKREEARDGGLLTSMIPAWCSINEQGKIVENDKANIVRRIFADVARGMGCWTIAKRLNDEHIPPLNGGKQKRDRDTGNALGPISELWSVSAVAKLIQNDAVLGWYQPHRLANGKREAIGASILYYPKIVDQTVADRARAQIASRRITVVNGKNRPFGGRKGVHLSNLFTGIAKCGVCGSSMFLYNFNPKRRTAGWLRCTNAIRSNSDVKCCNRSGIPYAVFEKFVVELIGGFTIPDEELAGPNQGVQELSERLATAQAEAAKAYESVSKWMEDEPTPLVRRRIAELEAKHAKLTTEITESEKRIERERGKPNPSEELEALQAMLKDMQSTNAETRLMTRTRVASGLKELVRSFLCFPNRGVIAQYELGGWMCFVRSWLRPDGNYEVYHLYWDWGQWKGKAILTPPIADWQRWVEDYDPEYRTLLPEGKPYTADVLRQTHKMLQHRDKLLAPL